MDQYIMNGGNVLWMVDPVIASEFDSLYSGQGQFMAIDRELNITDQLIQYGCFFNNIVQDKQCSHINVPVSNSILFPGPGPIIRS